MEKKIYILDTNVLLHDPQSVLNFADVHIGIPIVVLEELDRFKSESTDRGRSTRELIRLLDSLRASGSLGEGVQLENGSMLQVVFPSDNKQHHAVPLYDDIADNEILRTAVGFKNAGYHVTFISKDINARVKADVLGIESQDYLKNTVSPEEFYKGWITVQVPAVQLKREIPEEVKALGKEKNLLANQFVLAESTHNPFNYRVFRYLGTGKFKPVYVPKLHWPLEPRNPQQLMALDLLLDDSIQMVTLFGPAGTGKTFLALLSGLQKVLIDEEYKKILVSRPVVPLGRDIGYLPGDVQEKLHNWMQPVYDTVDFIAHSTQVGMHFDLSRDKDDEDFSRHGKGKRKGQKARESFLSVDDLVKRDKLSMEAITYMRGRSIPYQFILIDEVQNLTPHEVKTVISRVGEGSKIILAGDPYQIDSAYLDFSSNGLVVTTDRFKGASLFGTVFLETSERSELSQLVFDLL